MVLSKRKCTAIAAALSLAACFAMSGCSGSKAEPVELDGPCSFAAQITKGEHSFEAQFQRDSDGGWTAVFTSPDSLSDMTVKSFGEGCQIDYCGLVLDVETDRLPAGSVAAAVESCIDHASKSSSAKQSRDGDRTLVEGETGAGIYELRVSEGGELISLEIGTEICAEFSGFERLE